MKNELSLKGQFKTSTGELIHYTENSPLWLQICKRNQTANELRQFIKIEGAENLPELRGVVTWQKEGKRAEYIKNVVMIFDELADAERDEGLRQPSFQKAFFNAFMDNKDFYWLSPAHVKTAIYQGLTGAYNDKAKMYGNKITVRHLIEWLYCFQDEWFSGAHQDYDQYKQQNLQRGEVPILRDILKR